MKIASFLCLVAVLFTRIVNNRRRWRRADEIHWRSLYAGQQTVRGKVHFMKTIYLAFFQLLFVPFAAAQGTLQFHSTLSYLSDPSIQVGSGEFSLDRNLFWGASFFEPPNQFTSIRIEDATRSTVFETREIIDSAPLTFLQAKWNQVELTSSQVDSLIRGDWQVTIASVDFPEGEIVGRIELVPEPRPWLLFGLGFLLVAHFAHRNAVGSPARAGFNGNLPGR